MKVTPSLVGILPSLGWPLEGWQMFESWNARDAIALLPLIWQLACSSNKWWYPTWQTANISISPQNMKLHKTPALLIANCFHHCIGKNWTSKWNHCICDCGWNIWRSALSHAMEKLWSKNAATKHWSSLHGVWRKSIFIWNWCSVIWRWLHSLHHTVPHNHCKFTASAFKPHQPALSLKC